MWQIREFKYILSGSQNQKDFFKANTGIAPQSF